ncbi:MAG: hypothetical protein QOJ20_4465 [Mycobacterium sp.]|nr:hypothetical protein [Mycobacterium sp.]
MVATPGAGVLYTVAAGISRGWMASLVAAFACSNASSPAWPLCVPSRPGAGSPLDSRDARLLRTHAPVPGPVEEIAVAWIDRLELMLAALARDRDAIAPERSIDVGFDGFMADEMGVAEQVFGLVGEPVTDDARTAMADYLAGHQRGRLGRAVTPCEMFGLNEEDLRARFAPYVSRFLS